MKRINTLFKTIALTVCAAALLVACEQEPDNVARAVLGDVTLMNFAASNPAAQKVTVYSDGEWHTTAPDWITVDPSTGSGVTAVTVTAENNTDAQGMLEPRKDTLIISGNTLASRLIIIVSQEGNAYRNAQHLTLDKVAALANGKSFILDEATVVAKTTAGFVVNGGSTNMYVESSTDAGIGDKVSINGIKGSVNNLPAITQVDMITVTDHLDGPYSGYPEPIKLNDVIASYTGTAMEYVTVSGVVNGKNLMVTVDDEDYAIQQLDAPDELSFAGRNANRIDLTGYTAGLTGAKQFAIIATALKDNGPAVVPRPEKLLYAKWRFTTSLFPNYADLFGGTAGVVDLAEGFSELYVPSNVEGNGKITYYQVDKTGTTPTAGNPKRIVGGTGHPYVTGAWPGDYWLFSATDNYEYPEGTNLHIKFLTRISGTGQKYWMLEYFDGAEWQPADEYPVQTETETGTNAQYNFINPTSNVAVECYWKLAVPCREPMFRMRCVANWQSNGKGALANPNGGTVRIADNDDDGEDAGPVFEVTDAPGGGDDPNEVKLPVEWSIQTDANNFNETWPLANGSATEEGVSGYIASVTGTGTIWYNNEAGNAADLASGKKKTKLDIQALDPRVTGAWPGDYCQFKVPGVVSKGKKVRITFETRTSATNPKYWKLIYLDGNEWKAAAEIKTDKVEGTDVEFTHAMNADGATNVKVDATVTYSVKTENVVFRFVCQSAMGAGGDMLTAPNGGTWRLAVTDISTTEWQPRIQWGE